MKKIFSQKDRKLDQISFSLSLCTMLVLPAYAVLAVGPAMALYGVFIGRRRPFLFLVTLAS